jgi:hypothetical protein
MWIITQHAPDRFFRAFTTGIPFSWWRETLIASIGAPGSSNDWQRPANANGCCAYVTAIDWLCRLCPPRNNPARFGGVHERANSFNIDPPNACGPPFGPTPRRCSTK